MTAQEPAPKIQVWSSVQATYRRVFAAPGHFSRALAIPILLAAAIPMVDILLSAEQDSGLSSATIVLQLLPFVLVGLAWGRFILLNEAPSILHGNKEVRRFLVYAGYMLLFGLVFVVVIFASVVTLATAIPSYVALGIFVFMACFVVSGPLARLCLVLPATAIDQKLGLGGAWRLSGGNGLRLFAALLLAGLPVLIALAVFMVALGALVMTDSLATEPSLDRPQAAFVSFVIALFANGLQLIGFALIMGLLSGAYQQLSGWGAPREDILERFE